MNRTLHALFEEDGHRVDYLTADGVSDTRRHLLKRLVGLPAVTALAYRNITREDYDLVIANGEFAWGIDHPNVVCLFHGSYQGFRNYLKPYLSMRQYLSLSWHALIQKLAVRGKYVIAVSHFIKNILQSQGIHVSRVIENSIDASVFHPGIAEKSHRYLFVGTYHRYGKGFDVLEELSRRGYPIDCVTNTNPGQGLGHIGVVRRDEMPALYGRYRLLLFPSRFEAAQLVPLEAMSSGLPVVMTDVGIGQDIKKTIPEFVVDVSAKNLASSFAERISWIEQRYDEYSFAAREYVLRHRSYHRFTSEWLKFIRERTGC